MNFRGMNDARDRRNFLTMKLPHPMNCSVSNYSTDQNKDMQKSLEEVFSNYNLPLVSDPLRKNLADSIVTQTMNKKNLNFSAPPHKPVINYEKMERPRETSPPENREYHSSLSRIGNILSGFLNVISGAVFQTRAKSPVEFHDCVGSIDGRERSPSIEIWHKSNICDENKSKPDTNCTPDNFATKFNADMSTDCRAAAAHCEDKLNKVRHLLTSSQPSETPSRLKRRPRKVFIEPNLIEDNFEDAFAPEDFVDFTPEPLIQYCSPGSNQHMELSEIEAEKLRIHKSPINESMDIVKVVKDEEVMPNDVNNLLSNIVDQDSLQTDKVENKTNSEERHDQSSLEDLNKQNLITSCEDKVQKLKSMLQTQKNNRKSFDLVPENMLSDQKSAKPPRPIPSPKVKDKKFKNPNRMLDKRKKSRLRKHIQDDMAFGYEVESDELSSSIEQSSPLSKSPNTNSPLADTANIRALSIASDTLSNTSGTPSITVEAPETLEDKTNDFDEVAGRFHSTSTDSEDTFQIVFSDPKVARARTVSDCGSEDSFIVFEDSPDSCYVSNDVFGDGSNTETDTEESEVSDSDSESDSGSISNLSSCKAAQFSRTIADLTDDSLYEERDVVDCAPRMCDEISNEELDRVIEGTIDLTIDDESTIEKEERKGMLLNSARKQMKKLLPPKKVQFSPRPPEVHVLRVWNFAARQARIGDWEQHARDRGRFQRRIADADMAISWVLKPQHRSRVMFQRFMPWWNAEKRRERAEKKKRDEEAAKNELLRLEALANEVDDNNDDGDTTGDGIKDEVVVEDNKGDEESKVGDEGIKDKTTDVSDGEEVDKVSKGCIKNVEGKTGKDNVSKASSKNNEDKNNKVVNGKIDVIKDVNRENDIKKSIGKHEFDKMTGLVGNKFNNGTKFNWHRKGATHNGTVKVGNCTQDSRTKK